MFSLEGDGKVGRSEARVVIQAKWKEASWDGGFPSLVKGKKRAM